MYPTLYRLITFLTATFISVLAIQAQDCCAAISALGIQLSNHSRAYYSLYQSALDPACVVQPDAADQVGRIFALKTCDLKFAVRSGGHMTWAGASSIAAPGIVIDLVNLRGIRFDNADETVTMGPGLRWGDVYSYLAEFDRTTRGARMTGVGVGGFLIGGGISFPGDNFSSSLVIDYEVVLASGEVVHANATSYPDLFEVLKLGGSNFGVVTQFTMPTFPNFDAWGGVQILRPEEKQKAISALIDVAHGRVEENKHLMIVTMSQDSNIEIVTASTVESLRVASPALLDTVQFQKINRIYEDFSKLDLGVSGWYRWFTLTVQADEEMVMNVLRRGKELYEKRTGWKLCLQPLHGRLFKDNNPLLRAFSSVAGYLSPLVAIFISMEQEIDIRRLFDWTTKVCSPIVKPFVYLNYADAGQNAYNGVDLDPFWKAKSKYDPHDFFGSQRWSGGFKLPPASGIVGRHSSDL